MENYGYYSKEINEDCFVVYYFSRRVRSVIYQTSSLLGVLSQLTLLTFKHSIK